MEILRIVGLTKNFYLHNPQREIKSCQNISLSLEEGRFIGIVGLSGAGKSTILKCVNRTYLPFTGDIYYAAPSGRSTSQPPPSGKSYIFANMRSATSPSF